MIDVPCEILTQLGDQLSPVYEMRCGRCSAVFRAPSPNIPCPLCLARTQTKLERDEEPDLDKKGIKLMIPHTSYTPRDRLSIEPQINLAAAKPQRERAQRKREEREEARGRTSDAELELFTLLEERDELLDRLCQIQQQIADAVKRAGWE